MADDKKDQVERPPDRGTTALLEYFWAGTCDLNLYYFVVDTVLTGDCVAYILKNALTGDTTRGHTEPGELAQSAAPGPRVSRLRQSRQELLEMFLSRIVDNFQVYLTEIIRMVLQKRPEILSGRKQEISLGYILGFNSIESLIQDIVEGKVNSLSYDGFGEIEEWCNGRGIPLLVPTDERDNVVELIATRNLVVHNRGVVDDRFKKAVPSSPFEIGKKRTLEIDDVLAGLNLLNRIVTVSDGAIAGKFSLSRTEISNELRSRSDVRWPPLTETEAEKSEAATAVSESISESGATQA